MNLRTSILRRLLEACEAWGNGDILKFQEIFSQEYTSLISAGISVGRDCREARLRQSYGDQLNVELHTSVEALDLVAVGFATLSGAFCLRRGDGREIAGSFSHVWVEQSDGPHVVLDHATIPHYALLKAQNHARSIVRAAGDAARA